MATTKRVAGKTRVRCTGSSRPGVAHGWKDGAPKWRCRTCGKVWAGWTKTFPHQTWRPGDTVTRARKSSHTVKIGTFTVTKKRAPKKKRNGPWTVEQKRKTKGWF